MFVALFLGYSLISPVISGAVLGIVKLVVPAGILP
jgi:hypothetical protein